MIEIRETSGGVRYTVTQNDAALLTLQEIATTIETFNDDVRNERADHKDVTLADVTVEFTRMANGGRDPRPENKQAEDIVQQIMAEFVHALEEAQEDVA
jgi:hypothetical protein